MTINYTALTSLTNASASTAAGMLLDQIKTMLTANAAWTVVDDTSGIGSGAYRYLCFKNAAASSGLPNDYYVLFTLSGTSITLYMGESYNATTHVLSNCAPLLTASSVAVNATGQLASSPTITPQASTGAPTGSGTLTPFGINLSAASTTIYYTCAVYPEHFYLAVGSTSALGTGCVYVGGFEVLTSGGEPYPIVLGDLTTTSLSSVGFQTTRETTAAFSTSRPYPFQLCPFTGVTSALVPEYNRARTAAIDAAQGSTYPTSPVMALGNPGSSSSFTSTRGRFRNVLCASSAPPSMVAGDTVQIGSTYWALTACGGLYYFVDTGVAAP